MAFKYQIIIIQHDKQTPPTPEELASFTATYNAQGAQGWDIFQVVRAEGHIWAMAKQEYSSVPVNVVPPTLDKTSAILNDTINCQPGEWQGGGESLQLAFKWRRGGTVISGATTPSYVVKSADAGKVLTCECTATNSHGSGTALSNACSVAVLAEEGVEEEATAPINMMPPSIPDTAKLGDKLVCEPGTWQGNPAPTLKFNWRRNTGNIPDAITAQHTVTIADVGKALDCLVTATNEHGAAMEVTDDCIVAEPA